MPRMPKSAESCTEILAPVSAPQACTTATGNTEIKLKLLEDKLRADLLSKNIELLPKINALSKSDSLLVSREAKNYKYTLEDDDTFNVKPFIEVEELPKNYIATPIPTAGQLSKVYVNIKLVKEDPSAFFDIADSVLPSYNIDGETMKFAIIAADYDVEWGVSPIIVMYIFEESGMRILQLIVDDDKEGTIVIIKNKKTNEILQTSIGSIVGPDGGAPLFHSIELTDKPSGEDPFIIYPGEFNDKLNGLIALDNNFKLSPEGIDLSSIYQLKTTKYEEVYRPIPVKADARSIDTVYFNFDQEPASLYSLIDYVKYLKGNSDEEHTDPETGNTVYIYDLFYNVDRSILCSITSWSEGWAVSYLGLEFFYKTPDGQSRMAELRLKKDIFEEEITLTQVGFDNLEIKTMPFINETDLVEVLKEISPVISSTPFGKPIEHYFYSYWQFENNEWKPFGSGVEVDTNTAYILEIPNLETVSGTISKKDFKLLLSPQITTLILKHTEAGAISFDRTFYKAQLLTPITPEYEEYISKIIHFVSATELDEGTGDALQTGVIRFLKEPGEEIINWSLNYLAVKPTSSWVAFDYNLFGASGYVPVNAWSFDEENGAWKYTSYIGSTYNNTIPINDDTLFIVSLAKFNSPKIRLKYEKNIVASYEGADEYTLWCSIKPEDDLNVRVYQIASQHAYYD